MRPLSLANGSGWRLLQTQMPILGAIRAQAKSLLKTADFLYLPYLVYILTKRKKPYRTPSQTSVSAENHAKQLHAQIKL